MQDADLPAALSFLLEVDSTREPLHRRAGFLESAFDSDCWNLSIGIWRLTIDFRIQLEARIRLTDPKCRALLDVLKSWLCVQDHPDAAKGLVLAPRSMQHRIQAVVHLIDYFLLNEAPLGLVDFGLAAVTKSDVHALFNQLASHRDVSSSVYEWPGRLTAHLRAYGSAMPLADVRRIVEECPEIEADFPTTDDRLLSLSDHEIVLARAFLYREGLYRKCQTGYRFSPNTLKLAKRLYANTLSGCMDKPVPLELAVGPYEPLGRECRVSPSRDYLGEGIGDKNLALYNLALKTLELVPQIRVLPNFGSLKAWDKDSLQSTFASRPVGRTATLPVPVVLKSLKGAIEFVIGYGDDLVSALTNVTKHAQGRNLTRVELSLAEDIRPLLPPSLLRLGVESWLTEGRLGGRDSEGRITAQRMDKPEFFAQLRAHPGLWDLLLVLVGACFVIVATLTARRRGELCALRSGAALDSTGRYLRFFNRKSGPMGLRQLLERPIPQVGARALRLLERMDSEMCELGIKANGLLFKWPAFFGNGFTDIDPPRPTPALDRFCDYFQVELDEFGRRYYLRPHQFRRFFAMLFFWYGGFSQMDTLRWFLGHTDPEHLYRYITESTPGAVLRQEKAGYAIDAIEHGDEAAEKLRRVVLKHFKATAVSVIDSDELEEYVGRLLQSGSVTIEPVFLSDTTGATYRIAITVN